MQKWARFVILAGLFITSYLLILAWQKDYAQSTTKAQQTSTEVVSTQSTPSGNQAYIADGTPTVNPVAQQHDLISVKTDLYQLWINPKGGDIVRLELLSHHKSKQGEQPLVMLEQEKERLYIAQSGLLGLNGFNQAEQPLYEVEKTSYDATDFQTEGEQQRLTVKLVHKTVEGVEVVKSFHFEQGQYPIRVSHKVNNLSSQTWQTQMFAQLKRDNSADPGTDDQGIFTLGTYLGGAWGTPSEHYNKLKFANFSDEKLSVEAEGGWVAIVQHYFVSAWVPGSLHLTQDNGQVYKARLESSKSNDLNVIGFSSPTITVPAGTSMTVDATLYSGPKIQSELKSLAVGLNQTVDYGWLWPIAQLLFIGLEFFHKMVGNWGWSIILLTILVKLILWPLSAKSYRSMAKMRVIAPEMQRMKDEFGEDRMRFSQEMMALYKREQVNPLSGCLPLLLQMPIFLALYWVLMESVELRHAPWLGWIQDLSAMDPWFILPLLMGVTMWVQQRLNPQPTDPMQAKVFAMMPIIFTVFLLFFPAGLVLYWIINNLITILQQGLINKAVEKERVQKEQAST